MNSEGVVGDRGDLVHVSQVGSSEGMVVGVIDGDDSGSGSSNVVVSGLLYTTADRTLRQ